MLRPSVRSVSSLVVPRLADWAAVDVLEEDGSLKRGAIAHKEPEKVDWARRLQENYPSDPNAD